MTATHRVDKISFGDDASTFNGSFHLESITFVRDLTGPAQANGLWRYRVRAQMTSGRTIFVANSF